MENVTAYYYRQDTDIKWLLDDLMIPSRPIDEAKDIVDSFPVCISYMKGRPENEGGDVFEQNNRLLRIRQAAKKNPIIIFADFPRNEALIFPPNSILNSPGVHYIELPCSSPEAVLGSILLQQPIISDADMLSIEPLLTIQGQVLAAIETLENRFENEFHNHDESLIDHVKILDGFIENHLPEIETGLLKGIVYAMEEYLPYPYIAQNQLDLLRNLIKEKYS